MIKPEILHYCKYQERCHWEVRNKLYELGCRTAEVEEQIAELIGAGVLNEERFARAFARGKFRMKQWGREKIRQELKLRKISEYCIKKAMTEIDAEQYAAVLRKLGERKLLQLRTERSKPTKKAKLYRYLLQKGYERDIVMDEIKILIEN